MSTTAIAGWVLASLVSLLIIVSGIFKLTGSQKVIAPLEKANVARYKNILGVTEIVFAGLFLFPPTRQIGFLLLICYFSGAVAIDLSHQNIFVPALVILVLIFVAGYMMRPSLVFSI